MVFILTGLFHGRKFFGFTLLHKDFSLYMKGNIFEQLFFFHASKLFFHPSAEEIFVMYSHLVFFLKECFFTEENLSDLLLYRGGFILCIDSEDKVFLVFEIFSDRNYFLILLQRKSL